jgi:protein gp37
VSANSKIEWTNKTWNPLAAFLKRNITVESGGKRHVIFRGTRGWFCVKCSPGCANCYAEGINLRLGNGREYLHRNVDDIEFRLVNLEDPLKWRKPCMVFVNSMTDLFLEHIPDEMIDQVFAIMALAPQHTFQVLTKRAKRMEDYFATTNSPGYERRDKIDNQAGEFGACHCNLDAPNRWPLPNVWLGVSVEDQIRADERIPLLLQTPAKIRFLSCEPLLGPINLDRDLPSGVCTWSGVDWVIIGGESGPKARPCNIEWVSDIVDDCEAAGVPVFVKQLGARAVNDLQEPLLLRDRKGSDPSEWPEDLCIRQFPTRNDTKI